MDAASAAHCPTICSTLVASSGSWIWMGCDRSQVFRAIWPLAGETAAQVAPGAEIFRAPSSIFHNRVCVAAPTTNRRPSGSQARALTVPCPGNVSNRLTTLRVEKSQTSAVSSLLPLAKRRPSGEMARLCTSSAWSSRVANSSWVAGCHSLIRWSQLALARVCPSGVKAS